MRLRRRVPPARVALVAAAAGASAEEAARLAAQLGRGPGDVIRAAGQLAAASDDPAAARARLLQLLVDVERRSLSEAAELLSLPVADAATLLETARRGAGITPERCRGWPLVWVQVELTAAEKRAGAGHLEICRGCRDRLAAMERSRLALVSRATAITGLAGAGAVVAMSGSGAVAAGLGGLAAGKVAVVGALGAAVLAAGGMAAVVQHEPARPHVSPEPLVSPSAEPATSPVARSPLPAAPTSVPPQRMLPEPSPTASVVVVVPSTLPVVPTLPAVPSLPAVPTLPTLPTPSLPVAPSLPPLPLPLLSAVPLLR